MKSRSETDKGRLLKTYSAAVPRYTSYPTAPHFHAGVGPERTAAWLRDIDPQSSLSLYLHVPYCDTLCWFCGCHTKITRRYTPVKDYLEALYCEIGSVASLLPPGPRVRHIHWGGGSPTLLEPDDIVALAGEIAGQFNVGDETEFAIEIDPRGFDQARAKALAKAGLTRASIGVQDFDETVQTAINRVQSFEETRQAVEWLRGEGVPGINIDAMYGLPHQTLDAVAGTIARVIELEPDRVALFGYAHVPWLKRHQSMIDEEALPGTPERYRQALHAAELLKAAGYVQIGLDHFARATDGLSRALEVGELKRNFQGYTTDGAEVLIGLGASAISSYQGGYCQNETAIAGYKRTVTEGRLATVRGVELSRDDRIRRWVIEQIMCNFELTRSALAEQFDGPMDGVFYDLEAMGAFERDGLIERTGDGFRVTETGRPFVRAICAHFDAYLKRREVGHSTAV